MPIVYRIALLLLVFSLQTTSLDVVWVAGGDLFIWQDGETTTLTEGDVVAPVFSDDGQVAYTRGPDGLPTSLWVQDTELVALEDPTHIIGQFEWRDENTLVYNTLQIDQTFGLSQNDDLYTVSLDGQTEDLELGGPFVTDPALISVAKSPFDGNDMLVIGHGLEDAPFPLFVFDGIASGGHSAYIPPMHATPEGDVRIAVPPADLIFGDTEGLTTLWAFSLDGQQTELGTVQASFFGQPLWSDNGQWIRYTQRKTTNLSNQFDLLTAEGDGSNPRVIVDSGQASLEPGPWLPGTNEFVYFLDRALWIAGPNTEPRLLLEEPIFAPQFISAETFVYIHADTGSLRARIDGEPVTIATPSTPITGYDINTTE